MSFAPLPPSESELMRLDILRQYSVLDTPAEVVLDDLTQLAATICNTPIALISLVDDQRQWFKSKVGLDVSETPRAIAFCSYAIQQADVFVVPDATVDERFNDNPLVTSEPHIRFYAGAPLTTPEGLRIGTLCVIDLTARAIAPHQIQAIQRLANQVMTHLNLRRTLLELRADSSSIQEAFLAVQQTCDTLEQQVIQYTQALETANHNLQVEVEERQQAELLLQHMNDILEQRVAERTAKLIQANVDRALLFNLSLDLICIAGTDGYFKQINPAFSSLLGYSETELLTQPFLAFVHPEDIAATQQEIASLALGLPTNYFENRYRCQAGHYYWLAWKAVSVPELGLIYAIGRDITERKDAERERLNLLAREHEARTAAELAQRRITNILERITDAFFAVDPQWQLIYLNPQAEVLLQCDRHAVIGLTLWEALPPAIGSDKTAEYEQAMSDRISVAFEAVYEPLNHWFAVHVYPADDGISIYVQDISDRKQSEQALQQSEVRYRMLFELNPHPMWVYDVDTLQFLAVNRAAVEHYGYSAQEFLGMTLEDIRPVADIPKLRQAIYQPQLGLLQAGIWTHQRRDGSLIQVDIHAHPLPFDHKRAKVVLAHDVTERLQAETRLLETTRLQQAILDGANYTIISTDQHGVIQTFNAAAEQLLGYTATEVVGRQTPELIHDRQELIDYAHQLSQQFGTAIAPGIEALMAKPQRGLVEEREWTYIRCDGTTFPVHLSITTLRDDYGQITGFLSIGSDITERKQLEAQFLRAQRLESVGTLASGMAHDLNNALAPILMSIQLLQRQVTDPKGLRWLQTIETSTKRGAELVRQVLSFARGIEGDRTTLAVPDLIQEVVQILRETLPRAIDLDVTLVEPATLMVLGDLTQLHQVLMNLCLNARDAMPCGGQLHIQAQPYQVDEDLARRQLEAQPGPYVEITVTDTGNGILPQWLDRIFEPFFTTKPRGKGTALGLSTALGSVQNHQGFITVESVAQVGTTFRVYLPVIHSSTLPAAETAALTLPWGAGEVILVADDEVALRELTQAALEAHNYKVITAQDGVEAIALYAEHREVIRVAIVDLVMPTMDGITVIRTLAQINPHLRVIASSGLSSKQETFAIAKSLIQGFLPKPYTTATLLQTLHQVLTQAAP